MPCPIGLAKKIDGLIITPEAILAKDLCVQFKDRTASTATMMQELYVAGMQDMRLLKIRNDLLNEVVILY